MGRAVIAIVRPSLKAPPTSHVPLQNSPGQSVGTEVQRTDMTDFSQAGPVLELVAQMNSLQTVKTIEVRQPAFLLRAPLTLMAQKTEGIVDQRLMQTYPDNPARTSYRYGKMAAPARIQNVPGYVVRQTITTKASTGYPTQALRAPKVPVGGGQCSE